MLWVGWASQSGALVFPARPGSKQQAAFKDTEERALWFSGWKQFFMEWLTVICLRIDFDWTET